MSLLQDPTIYAPRHPGLPSRPKDPNLKQQQRQSSGSGLRARASLSALVDFVRDPVATFSGVVDGWYDGLTKEERERSMQVQTRKQLLHLQMRNAANYGEWKDAATELDELEHNNSWKGIVESEEYSPEEVQSRLTQLDDARLCCDVRRMLFLVRTSLTRNLGNMGNLKLYKHSHVGTKDLIERYINSALDTLDALLEISERSPTNGFGAKHMLDQVLGARQAFGRSALLLSGGANFGMSHIGVLKALWEAKLLPRIISGASAGSIVSSVLCTRVDDEIPELLANFCQGDLAVFEEEGHEGSVLTKAAHFLKFGAVFDISHLIRIMKEMLGDITFQEAYNRTRRILNICVSSASLYELPRLLNYITAPNVLIWSAVAASCSVPLVFSAASLLAKDPKTGESVPWNPSPQKWIDGSVDNDLPMTRLAEMFNVNHFIVSQVNPHVVPFLIKEEDMLPVHGQGPSPPLSDTPSWLHTVTHLAKSEALYRMHTLIDFGIFPNTLSKTVSVLSQKYSGDITILPEISYADFPRMLSNPSPDFIENAMLAGERATWPKFSRIRNHLAIELALDDAVQKLRTRVVFSSSQTDLRLSSYGRSKPEQRNRVDVRRSTPARHKRKMSQASDPNASVEGAIRQQIRIEHTKESSREKARSLYFPPGYDMDRAGRPPSSSSTLRQSTTAELNLFSDIMSSGAEETSNIYTSDSFADQSSSSTESPLSPSSPAEPDWDDKRRLFPSFSVPSTPGTHNRRSSSYLALTSPKPTSTTASSKPLPIVPTSSTSKSSPQEARYKKLFHGAKARVKSPGSGRVPRVEMTSPPPETVKGPKRFNALGLEIDLSGTRGMMLRKKRPSP